MAKAITLMTAEDLLELPSDRRCELIDGVLIEMSPTNFRHGAIEFSAARLIDSFVRPRDLGWVVVGEVGFILRRNPDRVRTPDVAFVRRERLPRIPGTGFLDIPPDLVVEVVSPTETPAEIQAKIRDWVEAGVPLQWWLYPDTRSVQVVRSLIDREELNVNDTLDGAALLPGFACPVADLFA